MTDEIFLLQGEKVSELPVRSMRQGLLGVKLENALQTLLERYPQIIPGRQIDPSAEDPLMSGRGFGYMPIARTSWVARMTGPLLRYHPN